MNIPNYDIALQQYNEAKQTGFFDKKTNNFTFLYNNYPILMSVAEEIKQKFNLTRMCESLYWIANGIKEYPHCQYHSHKKCNDHPQWINPREGYRKACKYCRYNNPDFLATVQDGIKRKYGVSNIMKIPSFVKKRNETQIRKYGGVCMASEIIRNNFKKTMMEKYGTDNAAHVPELHQKSIDNRNKVLQEHKDEIFEKKKQTEIKKYGCLFIQRDEYKKEHAEYMNSKQEYRDYAIKKEKELRDEWDIELLEKIVWGQDKYSFKCLSCGTVYDQEEQKLSLTGIRNGKTYWCTKCYPVSGGKSRPEYELKIFFQKQFGKDFKIIHGSRAIIPNSNKELDLYFPDYKIAIEYCGLIYHANKGFGYQNGGYDPDYHYQKFKLCQQNGIKLISLFENEWFHAKQRKDIKDRILKYFGLCTQKEINKIAQISNADCLNFLNNNTFYTQFLGNNCVCYGLYDENELLSVMIHTQDHKPIIYIKNDTNITNLNNFLKNNGFCEIITDNRYPITYDNLNDYCKGFTWESFKGFTDKIYTTYPLKDSKPYIQINDCGYSLLKL